MSQVTAAVPDGARRTTYAGLAALEAVPDSPRGTVVCIAGFTGSKEDFSPTLPLLAAAGWRVVTIDQRGQYESPGVDDTEAYRTEALAQDLLAVIHEVGAPVHLVAHSFGGLVARAAVISDPSSVHDLVLLGSGPSALPPPRADIVRLMRPIIEKDGLQALADAAAAFAEADQARAPQPQPVKDFLHARHCANHPVAVVEMADTLLSEPDRVAELAATGVRLLVAHGEGDDAWSPAVQKDMADRLGADYAVITGSLHSPAAENPESTATVLLEFWG